MTQSENFMNQFFGKDFESYMGQFSNSQFDYKSLLETQRKNTEAFGEAMKLAGEGFQNYTKKCSEVMSQFVEEQSNLTHELIKDGTPQDKISRQAEILQKSYDKSVKTAKELADVLSKSNKQSTDLINKRVSASLKEIKDALADKGEKVSAKKAS